MSSAIFFSELFQLIVRPHVRDFRFLGIPLLGLQEMSVVMTVFFCTPKQWNVKNTETSDVRINNRLKKFRSNTERLYEDLLKRYSVVSAELLENETITIDEKGNVHIPSTPA